MCTAQIFHKELRDLKIVFNLLNTKTDLSSLHLEHSQHCDGKGVKVGGRGPEVEVECSSKKLHAEESEDEDEEEQEKQERHDGLEGAEQRHHEVP